MMSCSSSAALLNRIILIKHFLHVPKCFHQLQKYSCLSVGLFLHCGYFLPFFSYNVNWHEDNLSVDHEHRWFVRGEGKFVFHEITSSAVCRWETCCGNILLLAWTPSSSSKCIKPRFLIMLNLSFYYSSYICRNGILIDPPNTFLQSPRFCKGWFFFLT